MTIYHFEVVSIRREKTAKCSVCGKRLKRVMTFDQTINPYNKNAQRMVKSREEINVELRVEAEAWMTAPERCSACLGAKP